MNAATVLLSLAMLLLALGVAALNDRWKARAARRSGRGVARIAKREAWFILGAWLFLVSVVLCALVLAIPRAGGPRSDSFYTTLAIGLGVVTLITLVLIANVYRASKAEPKPARPVEPNPPTPIWLWVVLIGGVIATAGGVVAALSARERH